MQIYGIDFTSRPKRSKPITCLACTLEGTHLTANDLTEWRGFDGFEEMLKRPGPWIAGMDFPFGQARRFIETIGWPATWQGYVDHVAQMTRAEFREALDAYRKPRPPGDKEHRRQTDSAAGSISPQKLYGTPVGLMFYEGAPRLRRSEVTIPHLQQGDPERIVVEAYPGVLARQLIGKRSYKQDTKAKQTPEQHQARRDILEKIKDGALLPTHGISVDAPDHLSDDPGADHLDALLCAIQAAWAYTNRHNNYGAPADPDTLEGWIADPIL
ncbi:MAG: DUF429 domain-containing protein [Rhodospirillales bacterium]|nr:DUF429 domain-containing protein [Rhodospirillales bacterium]